MKKLAIIGASYLQNPLIIKAKEMGLETHVFAWECGDVGEKTADFFYPISIREKEKILEKCREIKVDGVCSISSDLAASTVNYVAYNLGLNGNSLVSSEISTNKHLMREAFEQNGIPSPYSILAEGFDDVPINKRIYPLIVKPTDRSGSRGITKVYSDDELQQAIEIAKDLSFEGKALVEEFVEGDEYSVECISFEGHHKILSVTKKYTTGSPRFIETGHIEPAPGIDYENIAKVVYSSLDALKITNSASHSELKIDSTGKVKIIEIGGRMGGDFIGSDLVRLSTGVDFTQAVINVALRKKPDLSPQSHYAYAAVRFILDDNDKNALDRILKYDSQLIEDYKVDNDLSADVSDSSSRHGYFLFHASDLDTALKYLPKGKGDE